MLTDKKGRAEIDTSTLGDNTIIAAPSTGHIEIDHISVMPTGGANTLIFKDGSTQMFAYELDDNQGYAFDNANINNNTIALSEGQALVLNLSAATQVSGFILYRVVGQ